MGSLKDGVSEFTQSDRVELPLYSACMNYFNKPCDGANAIVLKNFFDYLSKNEEKAILGKGFYEIESELAASVLLNARRLFFSSFSFTYFRNTRSFLSACSARSRACENGIRACRGKSASGAPCSNSLAE